MTISNEEVKDHVIFLTMTVEKLKKEIKDYDKRLKDLEFGESCRLQQNGFLNEWKSKVERKLKENGMNINNY